MGFDIEKGKYNEIRDKLREKELALTQSSEEVQTLRRKLEEAGNRNRQIAEEYRHENEMLSKRVDAINAQATESVRSLEGQLGRANKDLQISREEIAELEQAIFVERENNNSMSESINKLRIEMEEVRFKLESMQKSYSELLEENREKDEHMFELGGKLYEYETKMRDLQEDKLREIEELTHSFNIKYDEDYQEINQKVELIDKEKEYFKEKLEQKEQELARKIEEVKMREIEEIEMKKMFQDKIKKVEEDKLVMFSDKNKEITKIMEENKAQFESIRQKDNQLRKIIHELQISRSSIQKLEGKVKEMQNERNTQTKAFQVQIENLRKKELVLKSYKDTVMSSQWNCEREVRKLIQTFIKKVLQNGEKQGRHQHLINSIKGMEEGMLTAIASVGKEGS